MTVNTIHDIIIAPNPYSYTVKFVFEGVRIHKDQQMRCLKVDGIHT